MIIIIIIIINWLYKYLENSTDKFTKLLMIKKQNYEC